jgi:phage antirepressor YoqD-like protein
MNEKELAVILEQSVFAIDSLKKAIEELRPLADFGRAVIDDDKNYSMSEAAKTFHEHIKAETGKDIGRNKLFEALRAMKILRYNNEPYQEQLTAGRFTVGQCQTQAGMVPVTRLTGKGLLYILPRLVEFYK